MTTAPDSGWMDLSAGMLLIAAYAVGIAGIICKLRTRGIPLAQAVALAIPMAQAAFSLIFQIRFLSGIPWIAAALSGVFLILCLRRVYGSRRQLLFDGRHLLRMARSHPWVAGPLAVCLLYTFSQALFLPLKNLDALTYHLPRVFLFIQENTFFLSAFNRYHEVVFPVGSDVLFYPFVSLQTLCGPAVFSLSSYVGIGAAVYALARLYGSQRTAALCSLVVMSLPAIALQAATVKNDIVMAAVAGACLVLILYPSRETVLRRLLFAAGLCAFGVSVKTTFLAFVPGIAILTVLRFRLYCPARVAELLDAVRRDFKFVLVALPVLVFLSPVWLFVWNAGNHETWTGPDSFTHRHEQHDGLLGGAANVFRYGLQILQAGPITDTLGSSVLGVPHFSKQLTEWYGRVAKPFLGDAGASREEFEVLWVTHEDYAWFGPLGAFVFFFCIPFALLRKPSIALVLLPAAFYFLVLAAKVSWMPWNGRFFTTFFVALTPALAVVLESFHSRYFRGGLLLAALASLFVVKTTDFSRPLLPVARELYFGESVNPVDILRNAFAKESMAWSGAYRNRELHKGEPSHLLGDLPRGSSVGIYLESHNPHYGFFNARPDLNWRPLNHITGEGTLSGNRALVLFARSELDYLLMVDLYSKNLDPYLIRASEDGYAYLIAHPRTRSPSKPPTDPASTPSQHSD